MTTAARILLLATAVGAVAAWYAKHAGTSATQPRKSAPITLPGVPYHL